MSSVANALRQRGLESVIINKATWLDGDLLPPVRGVALFLCVGLRPSLGSSAHGAAPPHRALVGGSDRT